jgi:hypothetical protein
MMRTDCPKGQNVFRAHGSDKRASHTEIHHKAFDNIFIPAPCFAMACLLFQSLPLRYRIASRLLQAKLAASLMIA